MRIVIQRVSKASVKVENKIVAEIKSGLLVLAGLYEDDIMKDIEYLANKTTNLRIFNDENGNMNLSIKDMGGEILAVSQFTLYGDCRKGRRPSFSRAMNQEKAVQMFDNFIHELKKSGLIVKTGVFGAKMDIELVNSGPVTMLLDSTRLF